MKRACWIVLLAMASTAWSPRARALEPASRSERTLPLHLEDALARVDRFDPQLREKAFARAVEVVNLRRAQWNRVIGNVRLTGSESLIAAGVGAFGEQAPPSAVTAENHAVSAQATLQVPLYAGGGIEAAIEAAGARLAAAGSDRERTRQELRAAAARAYVELAYSIRSREIATLASERATRLVEQAFARVTSGVVPAADGARAEVNAVARQESQASSEGAEARAQAVLGAALLLDKAETVKPLDDLNVLVASALASKARSPAERSDVSAQRQRIDALEGDRRQAFAAYLPRLDVIGMAQYGNGSSSNGSSGGLGASSPSGVGSPGSSGTGSISVLTGSPVVSGTFYAGLQLSWTAWDFFVTRDNVARAEALVGQGQAKLADLERRAARERAEARATEAQAGARLAVLERGVRIADESVTLDVARYHSGTALLSEVVQAELASIDIQQRFAQAAFDLVRAHIDSLLAEGYSP